MVGNGFRGEFQPPAFLNGGLLHQKSRDALIQTFPHDLFDEPHHIELDRTQHAGCGKQAHIPVKQSVDGDLPPLLRKDKCAQLPGLYQEQPGAVHAAVVYNGSLFYRPGHDRAKNAVLLYGGAVFPIQEK